MSEIHLSGSIPVTVVVDLDDGSVSRVIAHDDCFEYEVNDEGFQVLGVDTQDATDAEADQAKRIAESDLWPGWEWGW